MTTATHTDSWVTSDEQTLDLVHQLATIEDTLEDRLGRNVDALIDPASGRPVILRHAWEELRASEERLRLLLEQVPAAMWTTDRDLNLSSVMGSALASVGLYPEQTTGKTVDLLNPFAPATPGAAHLIEAHRQALEGRSTTYESRWAGRAYQVWIEPLRNRAGQIVGCLGLALDISERARIENELERRVQERTAELSAAYEQLRIQQEELRHWNQALAAARQDAEAERWHYRELFDLAPDGYVVTDRLGMIREANLAAARLLNVPRQYLVGKSLVVYVPDTLKKTFRERLWQLAQGNLDEVRGWDMLVQPRGGVPANVSITATPVRDSSGARIGVRWLIRDISQRKRMEQERERLLVQSVRDREIAQGLAAVLEQERDLLRTIMEHTHAQIAYLDREFRFVQVNAAYAHGSGYSVEALLGRYHFDLFPDEENEAIFRQVCDTGETASFQARPFVFPDRPELGTTYWDWTLAPVKGVNGEVQGLVCSLLDVTERERARQERESYTAGLDALLRVSQQVVAETTMEGVLERVLDAVCLLTGGRAGAAGQVGHDGILRMKSNAPHGQVLLSNREGLAHEGRLFWGRLVDRHVELLGEQASLRLTEEELHQHPTVRRMLARWPLPEGHMPLHSLLASRIVGRDGQTSGLILVSNKEQGEFTAEDEALLGQLAAIVSLALQHIAAREEAEQRANELDTVFEAIADGVTVYDLAGVAVRANPAMAGFYGVDPLGKSREELLQSFHMHDMDGRPLPAEDLPSTRALRGEQVRGKSFYLVNERGEERAVLASAAPLVADGQVTGVVAVWHDVTELHAAQARVRRYTERLRLLHETDEAILSSHSAEEMAQAVLHRLPGLLPCWRASVVQLDTEAGEKSVLAAYSANETDLRRGWREPLSEMWTQMVSALTEGREYIIEDVQELPPLSPMIKQLQAEGVRGIVMEPLLIQGKLIGSLNVGLDAPGSLPPEQVEVMRELAGPLAIGLEQARLHEEVQQYAGELERLVRRRTAALEASEARFRAVFEEAAIGIALMNREGHIVSSNPALQQILGYDQKELEGMSCLDLLALEDEQRGVALFDELIAGQRTEYTLEQRLLHHDGRVVDTNLTMSLVRRGRGRSSFVLALVEDISERKQAQQALIQSERLAITGRLAASMAHEVNNPLQSVTGSLELVSELLEEGEDPSPFMQVALEELERASRIVRQLRDLGRREQAQKEPVDVNELVDKVLLLTHKQCQNSHVEVNWEAGERLLPVPMLRDRIQQVFLNLVLNAVDAMPGGGELRIRTTRTEDPDGALVAFADTGVGIPPEELEHLFEAFHSTKVQGVGLGLYVSRNIVEEHGGHIDVQSKVDRGTTFAVWLPAESE